jgi:hypothetical protein
MRASISRDNLMNALDRWTGQPTAQGWPISGDLLTPWWDEYQAWERDETIARAFNDNRLAEKELKHAELRYGGPNATEPGNFAAYQRYGDKQTEYYPKHMYDTGVSGFVKRAKPEYWLGNDANKYTDGLHDVSMSILKAGKAIDKQAYHDLQYVDGFGKSKTGTVVLFVALPEPEDMAVFYRLNDIAKVVKKSCLDFYNRVRTFRSEMTRVKLAWDCDMASNFIALNPDNKEKPKLQYGMVNSIRVDGKITPATEADRKKARDTARPNWEEFRQGRSRNYKSILNEMKKQYNECTIAVRKHANPIFPVFTTWNYERQVFVKFAPVGRENTPDLDVPVPLLPVG